MIKKPYPVTVEWVDACSIQGWHAPTVDTEPLKITSCGLLIEKSDEKVVLALSISEGGNLGDVLTIPRNWAVKIRRLA